MPPHRGHQYLFEFALQYADEVAIFVCSLPEEPIPGELRYRWVREMTPDAHVVHITERIPEAQRDQPNSYAIWAQAMQAHLDSPVDFVFASEPYGWKLADALSARFVSVDAARHVFPISGTDIRSAPYENWQFIPDVVRPYFLKRIAVVESRNDGEGRFAHELASRLRTVVVQDYLTYWESLGVTMDTEEDLRHVLRAQRASERALAPHANGILVLAGEPLDLEIEWTERGRSLPTWYEREAEHRADHYLLVALPKDLQRTMEAKVASLGKGCHVLPAPDPAALERAVDVAKSILKR
jgi:NadR type nicotinamide-nucleotide adenylyltransferase